MAEEKKVRTVTTVDIPKPLYAQYKKKAAEKEIKTGEKTNAKALIIEALWKAIN